MQTNIAQVLALVIHGNASLQGRDVGPFFPTNSTCVHCESVTFVLLEPDNDGWREVPYASTPQQWFGHLAAAHTNGIRVGWESLNNPGLPDRMSVACVGGGGRWIIEVDGTVGCELWEARWTGSDRSRAKDYTWQVKYGRFAQDQPRRAPEHSLQNLAQELEGLLLQGIEFADRHQLNAFAPAFQLGLECLRSDVPLSLAHHSDIAPASFLGLDAERLLATVQASWVFGGMGSWNDIWLSDKALVEYESLSTTLYDTLNRAAIAAANSSYPLPG